MILLLFMFSLTSCSMAEEPPQDRSSISSEKDDGSLRDESPDGNASYVWLVEEEIEPGGILLGQPLSVKACIHYDIPVEVFPDDVLETEIHISIVNETGTEVSVVMERSVMIEGLQNRSNGVKIFRVTIPHEAIRDHIQFNSRKTPDLERAPNYMMVEVSINSKGGHNHSFENGSVNDHVISELYAVVLPSGCRGCPSFSPSIFSLLVGLAIVSLCGISPRSIFKFRPNL